MTAPYPGRSGRARWRIGIAGIAIEASTFSPHRTTLEDFDIRRGADLLGRYRWIDPGVRGAGNSRSTWAQGVEWVPLFHARALPGGPVLAKAYEAMESACLEAVRSAGDLDGVLLDIHGAMNVVGYSDAEARLASAIRALIGPGALISATMDLHGNVSRELASTADLLTCYRMAPHEDAEETRERAARNLVRRLRHGGRPKKAWVQVPVLLPGEKTSTRLEPARGLYGLLPDLEARDTIIDAAVWVGYAWGDEPRSRAAVVVTGDDENAVTEVARDLATRYWQVREQFHFAAPAADLDTCLAEALASGKRPFVISDSGDNPTAGGAGDVSYGLDRLLQVDALRSGEVTAVYAALFDPVAAGRAVAAGLGSTVDLEVGGHVDARFSAPVAVRAEVAGICRNDPQGGDVAGLRAGGLTFIVTSRRKQFDHIDSWTAAGADPRSADLVVVKMGYLEPELYALAADWRLALTPGGVDQDLVRLGHQHVRRPVYPLDPVMPAPDLTPELL